MLPHEKIGCLLLLILIVAAALFTFAHADVPRTYQHHGIFEQVIFSIEHPGGRRVYWSDGIEQPPPRYEISDSTPIIEINLTSAEIEAVCAPGGYWELACARPPGLLREATIELLPPTEHAEAMTFVSEHSGACIVLLPIDSWRLEHLRRHETAHCHGWRHPEGWDSEEIATGEW